MNGLWQPDTSVTLVCNHLDARWRGNDGKTESSTSGTFVCDPVPAYALWLVRLMGRHGL